MSVTVFCPNSRRLTIKTTPNTSILEILEIVCQKQGVNPQEFALFRNNKELDLSLTIRFANIPNNGQIDLKAAAVKRKDEKVTVAIDLETGDRKVGEFDSNQNLWDIIHQTFNDNPILVQNQDMNLCIIYMRKEIEGEVTLKQTTLRSLGLTNQKVSMRLLVRPKNASKEQAYVESLNLKGVNDSKEQSAINNVTQKSVQIVSNESKTTQKASDLPLEHQKTETTEPKATLHKSESSQSNLNSSDNSMSVSEVTNNENNQSESETQEMEVESSDSSDESDDVIHYLGGNNSEVIFKLSDGKKLSNVEITDDFFEVTKKDLVTLLKDLREQQVGNSEKSLETNEIRQQREREIMNKYKSTVIRICFPYDKLVLQAVFKPTDTIDSVMQVTNNYIKDEVKDFNLYTTPPKQILKPESTLYELHLIPAAVIHFGLKSSTSTDPVLKDDLKQKISSYKAVAKLALNLRQTTNESIPPQNTNQNVRQVSQLSSGSSGQSSSGSSGSALSRAHNPNDDKNERKKIPKWFKTNK